MNFSRKKVFFIILFSVILGNVSAQSGFIKQDSSLFVGQRFSIRYNADDNKMILQFKNYDKSYSPDTINEIGYDDDGKYLSRYISFYLPENKSNKVFLKQIVFGKSGDLGVYEYKTKDKRRLFYEKDSVIFEIPSEKGALRDTLRQLTSDNPSVRGAIRYFSGSYRSFEKFYSLYESSKPRYYPLSTWGVQVGGVMSSIVGIDNLAIPISTPSSDYNFSVGIFADISIYHSDFYFHPEIFYSQNSFSSTIQSTDSYRNFAVKYKYITVPILFRYIYPSLRWRPYFEFGFVGTRVFDQVGSVYNVKWDNASSNVYTTRLSGAVDLIDKSQYGLAAGLGFMYPLNYKNALSLGCRYGRPFLVENMGFSTLSVNLAYHF